MSRPPGPGAALTATQYNQNTLLPPARISFNASVQNGVVLARSAPPCSTYSCQLFSISSLKSWPSVPSRSPCWRFSGWYTTRSETRARARRRAFCFGSCTRNGFTGRRGPVMRWPGAGPPAGAAAGAAAGRIVGADGRPGGGAVAGRGCVAGGDAGAATGRPGGGGGVRDGPGGGAAGGDTTGPEKRGIAGGRGGAGAGVGAGGAAAGERRGGIRGGADTTPPGAAGARWAAATGGAVSAPRGSTAAPAGTFTGNTLLQTAQRARRPPGGILPGSTRYTVSHDGQVTFTLRSGYRASAFSSSSGSWRRSTTNTDPGCVFAYDFISVASSLTWAGCANRRCWLVTIPMDRVISGTRCSCPRRSLPK